MSCFVVTYTTLAYLTLSTLYASFKTAFLSGDKLMTQFELHGIGGGGGGGERVKVMLQRMDAILSLCPYTMISKVSSCSPAPSRLSMNPSKKSTFGSGNPNASVW